LFDSAAEVVGRNALGVILTGMGKDGAQGLLRLRRAGGRTFGQDEASCVVYGMPREAALVGAVEEVVALDAMARRVLSVLGKAVA
jgi:two-component system chemotaxis response regulator CheB